MMPELITTKISRERLKEHLETGFGDMIKFVVDIDKEIIAIGGEMHADCEELLLRQGSLEENLWGANIYPYENASERFEYSSLINIRPSQNNRNMIIQDKNICDRVHAIAVRLLLGNDDYLS